MAASTFCGATTDSESSLQHARSLSLQLAVVGAGGWAVLDCQSPRGEGQTASHLHLLQHLEAFNFPDAVVIQVNILKQKEVRLSCGDVPRPCFPEQEL